MAIGLSTYAFFWRISERVEHPLTLHQMLEHTHESGCSVLQICDYSPLETLSAAELAAVDQYAKELGIQLELGTRGITVEHLRRYLDYAAQLGVTLVRSMVNTSDHKPTEAEAVDLLLRAAPDRTPNAASPWRWRPTSRCLPRNWSASSKPRSRLRKPGYLPGSRELCRRPRATHRRRRTYRSVREELARQRLRLHRQTGWVGFNLTGCPLGEGLLDYDSVVNAVQPAANDINQIVEHWLPWQHDAETTCALEAQWTQHNIDYLRSKA